MTLSPQVRQVSPSKTGSNTQVCPVAMCLTWCTHDLNYRLSWKILISKACHNLVTFRKIISCTVSRCIVLTAIACILYQISLFGVTTKVKQAKNPHSTCTYLVTPTTPVGVTEFPPALFHDKSWLLNKTYRVWSIFFCAIVFCRI